MSPITHTMHTRITIAAFGIFALALLAGAMRTNFLNAQLDDSWAGRTTIVTATDTFPNLVSPPTITAAQSGDWSNAATWGGRVPGAADKVYIPLGKSVTIRDTNAMGKYVGVAGALAFDPQANTRFTGDTMYIYPPGSLTIGTATNPVAPWVTAEIIITGEAIDLSKDPSQLTKGLISFGNVSMYGAQKTTFARLATMPKAGATTLEFAEPINGWVAGDRLVVPDSRQAGTQYPEGTAQADLWIEKNVPVQSANGTTVTLAAPLKWDHPCALNADANKLSDRSVTVGFDGKKICGSVINLSRNIVIRSQVPGSRTSTLSRGHTLFAERGRVDIRYVDFRDLGRMTSELVDSTTFNADGTVKHIGTNQIGRYALHMHHQWGPYPAVDPYQFTLIGNSVESVMKWGYVIHDSHYGLLKDNVGFDALGALLTLETGNESYNVIDHNMMVYTRGSVNQEDPMRNNDPSVAAALATGHEGSNFWFGGANGTFTNNVAANGTQAGYQFIQSKPDLLRIPKFPGADLKVAANYTIALAINTFPVQFKNNEAYGMLGRSGKYDGNGLEHWGSNGISGSQFNYERLTRFKLENTVVWNNRGTGDMFDGGPHSNITFEGIISRGAYNGPRSTPCFRCNQGIFADPAYSDAAIINRGDIQGHDVGVVTPHSVLLVSNTVLRNVLDVRHAGNFGGHYFQFSDSTLDSIPGYPATLLDYRHHPEGDAAQAFLDPVLPDRVVFFNYNKTGVNYEVFKPHQARDTFAPLSVGWYEDSAPRPAAHWTIGCPDKTLTNAQCMEQYGIAAMGNVPPANCSLTKITGFDTGPICSFVGTPPLLFGPPKITMYTSTLSKEVQSTIKIIYFITGDTRTVDKLAYRLDNGPETVQTLVPAEWRDAQIRFENLQDIQNYGVTFTKPFDRPTYSLSNVSPGDHTITARLIDKQGQEIPGSVRSKQVTVVSSITPFLAIFSPRYDGVNRTKLTTPTWINYLTHGHFPADGSVQLQIDGLTPKTLPLNKTVEQLSIPLGDHTLTFSVRRADGSLIEGSQQVIPVTVTGNTAPAQASSTANTGPVAPVTATSTEMLLYYPLNETTGKVVTDASSFKTNGSVVGGMSWVAGKIGGAAKFNGVDGRIYVSGIQKMQTGTIATWFNAPKTGAISNFTGYADGGVYVTNDATGQNIVSFSYGPNAGDNLTSKSITLNAWHHLAVTFDGTTIKMYIDGTLAASKPFTGILGNSTLQLGWGWSGFNNWFQGYIDDYCIVGRALSATNIAKMATGTSCGAVVQPASSAASSAPSSVAPVSSSLPSSSLAASVASSSKAALSSAAPSSVPAVSSALSSVVPSSVAASSKATSSAPSSVAASSKAASSTPSSVVAAISSTAMSRSSVGNDLVVHWTLDETSGTTATDTSLKPNNGKTTGSVPTWQAGKLNGSLYFPGSQTAGTYLTAASKPSAQTSFTNSFWMNPEKTWYHTALMNDQGFGQAQINIDGTPHLIVTFGDNKVTYTPKATDEMFDGKWKHVAFSYVKGDTMKLYVNGVLVDTKPAKDVFRPFGFFGYSFQWGGGWIGFWSYFRGGLDDICLFKRALSETEVSKIATGKTCDAVSINMP